jgi:hypothetical protein
MHLHICFGFTCTDLFVEFFGVIGIGWWNLILGCLHAGHWEDGHTDEQIFMPTEAIYLQLRDHISLLSTVIETAYQLMALL